MRDHPLYMATVGAAIPSILNRRWTAVANSVRWTDSISVEELQSFMEELPGPPVPPDGDAMVARHILLSDDGVSRSIVAVPIELGGTDRQWLLTLTLELRETGDPDYPEYLWGLGEQRLLTPDELAGVCDR